MYRKVSFSYWLALIHVFPVYALKTGQEMRLRKCLICKRIFYSVNIYGGGGGGIQGAHS